MSDSGAIVVAQYMGISLGLGQLLTIFTQIVKTTDKIPALKNVPGVQWFLDTITTGNPVATRTFVGILAAVINVAFIYQQTGEFMSPMAIMATITTYVSSLGGYDLFFSGSKKNVPSA